MLMEWNIERERGDGRNREGIGILEWNIEVDELCNVISWTIVRHVMLLWCY